MAAVLKDHEIVTQGWQEVSVDIYEHPLMNSQSFNNPVTRVDEVSATILAPKSYMLSPPGLFAAPPEVVSGVAKLACDLRAQGRSNGIERAKRLSRW